MAENEGNALFNTEIGDPVPGEHTLYSDHDVLLEGGDDTKKGFRVGIDILMNPDVAPGIHDTDEHFFGMQVDSTIEFVLLGVKFHIGFLLLMGYAGVATLNLPFLGGGLK
jgi:hypothetical protein